MRILFSLVLIISLSPGVTAQVAGGSIQGSITDASHGAIGNAHVTIRSLDTGVTREVHTNGEGFYVVPNLLPGRYEVTASAAGFTQAVAPDIILTVGAEQVVNLTLAVGNQTQKITVTGAAPTVDTATSTVSGIVGQRTIADLPLNGRDWSSLATLQPGVSLIVTQPAQTTINSTRLNRGLGAQLTIGGNRPQQNNYRLDGVSINDYGNAAPGGVLGSNLGVDAVREFSVITNNAPAAYGRSSGGIVNAETRSGTNAFHGDAYEFLRNSALDARNFFDGSTIPPFRRNQFGASAGGPIIKNRTFFFGDYEGVRQALGVTDVIFVPSQAARNGQLASGNVAVDPKVAPYLALWHLPNGPVLGDTGPYSFVSNQVSDENFFTTRIDQTLSSGDFLHGTYLFDDGMTDGPDNTDSLVIAEVLRRQLATLEETHVFSVGFVNTARFGYSRTSADAPRTESIINPLANNPSLGFLPGVPPGQIQVTGLETFQGGPTGLGEFIYHYNSYQFYDDADVIKGTHTLQFGVAVERIQDNMTGSSHPLGQFKFGSLANFLTNKPTSIDSAISPFPTPRGVRQTIFGAYFQDDWHVRSKLTLNLGLRYEIASVPTEVQNKLTTLSSLTAVIPRTGSPYFQNPTLRDFAPRLGFSWDPFGNGKTAVRSAFGIYDSLPLPYLFESPMELSAPFFAEGTRNNLPQGSFPTGAFPVTNLRQAFIQSNPKRNYVMQWNLNVQRQLLKNLTLQAGYAGSEGVHQPFQVPEMNIVFPTLTPQGYLWPSPRGSGTVVNPTNGDIAGILWQGTSSYNALNAKVTAQTKWNLQVGGSYTWSKNLDTSSSAVTGSTFNNSLTELPFFDLRLTRSLSEFDVRHVFVANYLWQLPGPTKSLAFAGWAFRGWTWGGILTVRSGVPFTPIVGGDPLGLNGSLSFDYPDRLNGPGCTSAVNPGSVQYVKLQCFAVPNPITLLGNGGRNSLIGPGLVDLDQTLIKDNRIPKISERFEVQLQAEFFNIVNHTNFLPPAAAQAALFNQNGSPVPSGGQLTATATSSRQIQFALKLIW